jgi:hypothetical protein
VRCSVLLACATALACGEDRPEDATTFTQSGISLGEGGSDTGIDPDEGGETGPKLDVGVTTGMMGEGGEGGECPCQGVLDGIYVLDSNDPPSVYFYDPPANTFTQVGVLGCPAPLGSTANSMAIDREGYAWLNYYTTNGFQYEGFLYRAHLGDLADCEDLGYMAIGTWYLMGMGYSVIGEGSSCDQLYLYNSDQYINYPTFMGGSQLARWDEAGGMGVVIGDTPYPVGELSGTGDGRLFTFATVAQNQSVLARLDKGNASVLETIDLDNFDITNAFAFAFWGGDVYFFTETSPGSGTSKVTRLDYDMNEDGGMSTYNPAAGIHIPGAGVSTCASFVPPG